MKTRTVTVEVTYDEFEPGDRVTPSSRRSSLVFGQVYIVTQFYHPFLGGGETDGVVFVEGKEHGIDGRHLVLAEEAS